MRAAVREASATSVVDSRKAPVRINVARFWPGAAEDLIDTLLTDLKPYYDFTVSANPQVVLYGPYPGALPPGRYVKVFIGCENVRPLMNECDWAFGVDREEYFAHPRYMRIARWGDDTRLVKQDGQDWVRTLREKTRFCAFLYANSVFYREAFFRALSRYKRVDSPGSALNNMRIEPPPGYCGNWASKRAFLRNYKFVIAFENSSWPGYNTEKLTHAIEADCVPIYWGDPEVGRSFNVARFINAHDYLPKSRQLLPRLPYRPHSLSSTGNMGLAGRLARRSNRMMANIEQRLWARRGFDRLVERIIEIDRDDDLYLRHLREPFLLDNRPPDRTAWIARWHEIFAQSAYLNAR